MGLERSIGDDQDQNCHLCYPARRPEAGSDEDEDTTALFQTGKNPRGRLMSLTTEERGGVSLAPNKGGRPRKLEPNDATLRQLTGLSLIMCTTKEGSLVLGVTEPTFFKFLNDYPEAREAWEWGRAQGMISLRRKQFRLADTSATMAIFLGKNYLGQRDVPEPEWDLTGLTDEQLSVLVDVLSRCRPDGP
jgi:hypothetical protein